jgi:hypothetical protein
MDMPFKKRKIEENAQEVPQEVPEVSEAAIPGKTDLINSCLPGWCQWWWWRGGVSRSVSRNFITYHITK